MHNYSFLNITDYYKSTFHFFYKKYPRVKTLNYEEHLNLFLSEKFGMPDYYEKGLRKMGNEANSVILGDQLLLKKMAEHYGIPYFENEEKFLLEIFKIIKPNVVLLNTGRNFSTKFLQSVKSDCSSVKLLLGWCCAPYNDQILKQLSLCDVTIICSKLFEKTLNQKGIKTIEINHAFDETILSQIKPVKKQNSVSFVGSIIPGKGYHQERKEILEYLAENSIPLEFYGNVPHYNNFKIQLFPVIKKMAKAVSSCQEIFNIAPMPVIETVLSKGKPENVSLSDLLTKNARNPVFGIDMFQTLANYALTLNNHGSITGSFAANMRLFEATGIGTCLITDHKDNLPEFFEPDSEVVTYKSKEECLEKTRWLLDHPAEAHNIALAGQSKCLKKHNGFLRAEQFNAEILKLLAR